MKVLLVSSGNSGNFEITPFIKSQGDSLVQEGVEVSYFKIKDKGLFGYIKGVLELKKHLKKYTVDIIHAHYTLSGWSAVLSFPKQPIVLSLMGTDAYGHYIGVKKIKFSSRYLILLTKLIQPFVSKIICKTKHIESFVYLKNKSTVIPNGILLDKFTQENQGFRSELGLEHNIRYVLFLGDKMNIRKNYMLAKEAVNKINNPYIQLIRPYPITHEQVIKYLNSVDCLVVPSFMEGSPNIIKEAMASNCPIVATDVGDIKWLFGDEPGHYISSFDPIDMAKKIEFALEFSEKKDRTNGRDRIFQLGLDSKRIANRINDVYKNVLAKNE